MGRTVTPTYRVEMVLPGYAVTNPAWSVRAHGKPTSENLAKFIDAWDTVGFREGLPMITHARIVRQSTGASVATYAAPAFKAI